MAMLEKDICLFERDEEGNLIPRKVVIDDEETTITATPMPRGEIKKLFMDAMDENTTADQDKQIIMGHCLEPKFEEKDIDAMKPYIVSRITSAILKISGIKAPDKVSDAEDTIRKN